MQRDVFPLPPVLPPLRYGPLELHSRYLLSPLAGYTNLPFRRIVRELGGVGLATTDLVNARSLISGTPKAREMIETCSDDSPFAVQIFGHEVEWMTAAARLLEDRGVDSIDVNMGCPVERIAGKGSGAGMMRCADDTLRLIEEVVRSVRIPVTVKMRLGWDDSQITAPAFARAFEDVGVAAIAIHGRTREQGFRGTVNLDGIRKTAEAVRSIPVIGNGDVRNVADAARMLEVTGCDGVSVGRGALANPWIFRQLDEWERTGTYRPAGTFDERLDLMTRQFEYLAERRGAERAIVHFRKMGHWYLKGMRVRAWLRHRFQQARTRCELDAVIEDVRREGPVGGVRTGVLPDMHVPVPSGPVDRW